MRLLQETCIILPQFNVVLDTGRCPQRSCFQSTVLITHAHLDHLGGLPHYIATRYSAGGPSNDCLHST